MSQEPSSLDPVARPGTGGGYVPSMPSLPAGYTAQPVRGFSDKAGVIHYEFHRVYRPSANPTSNRPTRISELDEDLSFWAMSWTRIDQSGGEIPAGRWISYGQARKQKPASLTFDRFLQLHEEVPSLFP